MAERHRVRFRFRIGKPLTSDEMEVWLQIRGRDVLLAPQKRTQTFKETEWLTITAKDFDDEQTAREFGEQLRSIVEVAAMSARLGVDTGEDRITCFIAEGWAREIGLIAPDELVEPNVHGLIVHVDDDRVRYPLVEAVLKVTADPKQFFGALSELGALDPIDLAHVEQSIRALNSALLAKDQLARLVFAVSAIEALGQDESWTEVQNQMLRDAAKEIETLTIGSEAERAEVAAAISRGTFRIGLRQGVKRVLTRLDLSKLMKEWDRLYEIRSGIFHGTRKFSETEAAQLAEDAVQLCANVMIALLKEHGIPIPLVAEKHFAI